MEYKHKVVILYISIIAWILAINLSIAQNANVYEFSLNEGLPQSQVYALEQDMHGYIWLGTQGGGVSRFDGKTFEVFNNQGYVQSNFINCIEVNNKNNEVYIGSSKGVDVYVKNKFKALAFDDKSSHVITALKYVQNEVLYVGSTKGLYLSQNHKSIFIPQYLQKLKNSYINDVNVINDEVWIGTNTGLYILKNNILIRSNKAPSPNVAHIYQNDQGLVWLSILDYGLIQIEPLNKSIVKVIRDESISKSISCLEINDMLYIGSLNQGLYQYNLCDNTIAPSRDITNPLMKIRALKKDTWNNIWVATSGNGLLKITNQEFRHFYPSQSKIYDNRIYALGQNKEGSVITTCGPQTLASFNQTDFTILSDTISIGQKIKSLACDTLGRMWLASEGNGVFMLDSQETKHYCIENENFEDNYVNQIICQRNNNTIWFAFNSSGIASLQNGVFKKYSTANGLRDNYITCLTVDYKGNLWWGSRKGSIGYIDNRGKVYTLETFSDAIKTIASSDSGVIYFSISGEGVFTIKSNKISKLELENKTFSSNVYSMIVDAEG